MEKTNQHPDNPDHHAATTARKRVKTNITSPSSTIISLRNLSLQAVLGSDAWSRPSRAQPLLVSIRLTLPISLPAQNPSWAAKFDDTLAATLNYSTIAKNLSDRIQDETFSGLEHITQEITTVAAAWPGWRLRIEVRAPKAFVRGDGLNRVVWLVRDEYWKLMTARAVEKPTSNDQEQIITDGRAMGRGMVWTIFKHEYIIPSLNLACVIGLNEHERLEKQDVRFKVRFLMDNSGYEPPPHYYGPRRVLLRRDATWEEMSMEISWQTLVRQLTELIEATTFQTLETLAAHVAEWLLAEEESTQLVETRSKDDGERSQGSTDQVTNDAEDLNDYKEGLEEERPRIVPGMRGLKSLQGVSVAVEKPAAIAFVEGSGVEAIAVKDDGLGAYKGRKEEQFAQWHDSKVQDCGGPVWVAAENLPQPMAKINLDKF